MKMLEKLMPNEDEDEEKQEEKKISLYNLPLEIASHLIAFALVFARARAHT